MKVTKNLSQLGFYKGYANAFDFFRIRLSWRGCQGRMSFEIAILGMAVLVWFYNPFHGYFYRFRRWYSPCIDCGMRFGKHDESKEHLPF